MWLKPPHLILLFLATGGMVHLWSPSSRVEIGSNLLLGWGLTLAGVILVFLAKSTFQRHDTTHDPHGFPTALVTQGVFRLTRNPMYLGVTLFLLGIAVVVGTLPLYLAPLFFALAMHLVFIPREERRLTHVFGQAYLDYQSRTRRWI